jgi:hypothetical protein
MTVRIVQPADGSALLSFSYGDGTEVLTRGQLVSVDPGSVLETAIGTSNLTLPSAQQLASGMAGSEGAVSN